MPVGVMVEGEPSEGGVARGSVGAADTEEVSQDADIIRLRERGTGPPMHRRTEALTP